MPEEKSKCSLQCKAASSSIARSITPQSICSLVFPRKRCCAGFARRHRRQKPILNGCRVGCRWLRSYGENDLLYVSMTRALKRAGLCRQEASLGYCGLASMTLAWTKAGLVLMTLAWRRAGYGRLRASPGCDDLRDICGIDRVSDVSIWKVKGRLGWEEEMERSDCISHACLLKISCGNASCGQVRVEPSYRDVSCTLLAYSSDSDLGGGAGSRIGL